MEDMGDVVGGTGVHIVIACKALFDLERGVYEGDGVEASGAGGVVDLL